MHSYENLDKILLVECRPEGMPTGIIDKLYSVIRGDLPITYEAAKALDAMPSESRVAIITGIVIKSHLPKGEIDGPIGAVALGKVLAKLGHEVDILVPDMLISIIEVLKQKHNAKVNIINTTNFNQDQINNMINLYDSAVAIEKLAKNSVGVRHSIVGTQLEPEVPSLDELLAGIKEKGGLTIGIGDGGNEMGFGSIFKEAQKIVPYGSDCGCPCGKGIISKVATTILLPANVSNFGAYAIIAALAIKLRRNDLMPTGEQIVGLVKTAVDEGCLDGGTTKPGFVGDDGIPAIGIRAFVDVLYSIVQQTFVKFDRKF